MESGELTINFNNLSDLALNSAEWIYNNKELLKDFTITLGIGISGTLIYSQVVKAHGQSVNSVLKSDLYKSLTEIQKKKNY